MDTVVAEGPAQGEAPPRFSFEARDGGESTKELRTEIDIGAPVERVWQALMDFPAVPEWNPFIRRIRGELHIGSRLEVFLQPSGTRGMRFRPTVKKVEPNRELRWLGHLGIPGLFDGEHIFELEPAGPDRTHFVQRELFRGLLVPSLRAAWIETRDGDSKR